MTNDRENEMVDKSLLRDIVQVFESMGMDTLEVYTVDLEADVVKHTTLYYAQKAQEWMEIDATPQYLIKAEKALMTESLRVQQYLNLATEPKLLRAVEYEVLEKHEKGLLEKEHSGCIALLSNDKKEDLARMFRLFSRVPDGLVCTNTDLRSLVDIYDIIYIYIYSRIYPTTFINYRSKIIHTTQTSLVDSHCRTRTATHYENGKCRD